MCKGTSWGLVKIQVLIQSTGEWAGDSAFLTSPQEMPTNQILEPMGLGWLIGIPWEGITALDHPRLTTGHSDLEGPA